jgi:Mn2+/Fe2+ NRAMP family transporter
LVGKPRELLILAGAVNGLILPIALAVILIAATKKRLMKDYRHPLWMQLSGWFVVVAMSWMGYLAVMEMWGKW